MGQSFQGKGRSSSRSWKGCSLWGKAPLDTPSLPSALQKPLCPLTAQGLGTKQHTRHSFLLTPRPPRLSGENRGYGAEPRNQQSGRGAQRRRPRASSGLAARPHVAGPRGGGTGAEGEGLHLREVPGWSRPPALSAFPAQRLSPSDPGEVSRKKMPGAPRGPGAARSRCEVRDAPRGFWGLKAAPAQTLTCWAPGGGGLGSGARLGTRERGLGGGDLRPRPLRAVGARPREGRAPGPRCPCVLPPADGEGRGV